MVVGKDMGSGVEMGTSKGTRGQSSGTVAFRIGLPLDIYVQEAGCRNARVFNNQGICFTQAGSRCSMLGASATLTLRVGHLMVTFKFPLPSQFVLQLST